MPKLKWCFQVVQELKSTGRAQEENQVVTWNEEDVLNRCSPGQVT